MRKSANHPVIHVENEIPAEKLERLIKLSEESVANLTTILKDAKKSLERLKKRRRSNP